MSLLGVTGTRETEQADAKALRLKECQARSKIILIPSIYLNKQKLWILHEFILCMCQFDRIFIQPCSVEGSLALLLWWSARTYDVYVCMLESLGLCCSCFSIPMLVNNSFLKTRVPETFHIHCGHHVGILSKCNQLIKGPPPTCSGSTCKYAKVNVVVNIFFGNHSQG